MVAFLCAWEEWDSHQIASQAILSSLGNRRTDEFKLQYHPALQGKQSCAVLPPSFTVEVPLWQAVGTVAPSGQKCPMGHGPPTCTAAGEYIFCHRSGDFPGPTPARHKYPSAHGPNARAPSQACPEPQSMHCESTDIQCICSCW